MQLPSSYHANVQRVSGDEEEVESLFDEDREDREITANLLYLKGTNFRFFRGFSAKSRKFEPAKIFQSSKPRKLITAKN